MSNSIETAKHYIIENNYKEAIKIARKRHGKDDVKDYLEILDLLIDSDYLLQLKKKEYTISIMMNLMIMETMVKNTSINTWNNNLIP